MVAKHLFHKKIARVKKKNDDFVFLLIKGPLLI